MRHFSSASRAVAIDECPTCAGIWLDSGELERIRSEHPSAEDRRRAVVKAFEERAIDDRIALIEKQLDPVFPFAAWRSRMASTAVVVFYVVAVTASRVNAPGLIVRIVMFCVMPLACIWFPDVLGNLAQGRFTRTSPRSVVWFFGWIVLMLPIIQVAILLAEGVRQSP
jgi:Zn-finger nucleic acid-binding protein